MEKPKIVLGCTGSVAACRVSEISSTLISKLNAEVRIVPTCKSLFFLNANEVENTLFQNCGAKIYTDDDEWKWKGFGDDILHIELKKWGDLLLLAPLDANTLSKVANGMSDNLLTCVARAWEVPKKPVLFALAMNSTMLQHPVTSEHIAKLKSWGYIEIPTVEKMLACGDSGPGGIADTSTIISTVKSILKI